MFTDFRPIGILFPDWECSIAVRLHKAASGVGVMQAIRPKGNTGYFVVTASGHCGSIFEAVREAVEHYERWISPVNKALVDRRYEQMKSHIARCQAMNGR